MLRAPISLAGSTRRGMVTAQVVLSMSVLMAMLAVVADGGLLLVEPGTSRRRPTRSPWPPPPTLLQMEHQLWRTRADRISSAMGVASANGYTNDGTTSTVTVNISPAATVEP